MSARVEKKKELESVLSEVFDIHPLVPLIENELLPGLTLATPRLHDPVVPLRVPEPWRVIGTGNYAAVLLHPSVPDCVVKVYAEEREGIDNEIAVYGKLGRHPAFSECFHGNAGKRYLVLKRLTGVTLYDCLKRGIRIEERVIRDVDDALLYARACGLNPHDVHGKNVIQHEGRGYVVDVSDFLDEEPCSMWPDLKRAYEKLYKPLLLRRPFPLPPYALTLVRKGYRLLRKNARRRRR